MYEPLGSCTKPIIRSVDMKIKYINVNNTRPVMLSVTHNDREIFFALNRVIEKAKKYDLESEDQFLLLEKFLDIKGEKFKTQLFSQLVILKDTATELMVDNGFIFKENMSNMINMFNFEELRNFIENYPIIPPTALVDEFDMSNEKDNIGTKIQTYTKDQYLDLVSIALLSKLFVGPIGHYYNANTNETLETAKEYSLIFLIINNSNWLKDNVIINKLVDSFDLIVENTLSNSKDKGVSFTRGVAKSDFKLYLLGLTLIKLMPVSITTRDNSSTNIITFIYSTAMKILNTNTGILEKQPKQEEGETESALEIIRITSDIALGTASEFKLYLGDIYKVLEFYNIEDKDRIVPIVLSSLEKLYKFKIVNEDVLILCSWIMSITPVKNDPRVIGYIRPESFKYLNLKNPNKKLGDLINLLTICYTITYYLDFRVLGDYICSIKVTDETVITPTTANEQIKKSTKIELANRYSLNTTVNNDEIDTILIVDCINSYAKILLETNYRCLLPESLRHSKLEILEKRSDIKEQLAQLLLKLFEHRDISKKQ